MNSKDCLALAIKVCILFDDKRSSQVLFREEKYIP